MLSSRKPLLRWWAPLLLVTLAGCGGGGPNIVEVSGVLTYKGQPAPNAYVDFLPENGRQSWGLTDEQGHFKLNYDPQHDGAIVGKHKVSVRPNAGRPNTPKEQDAFMRTGKMPPPSKEMSELYSKYSAEKSKKEVVIEKSTKDLKLDLD